MLPSKEKVEKSAAMYGGKARKGKVGREGAEGEGGREFKSALSSKIGLRLNATRPNTASPPRRTPEHPNTRTQDDLNKAFQRHTRHAPEAIVAAVMCIVGFGGPRTKLCLVTSAVPDNPHCAPSCNTPPPLCAGVYSIPSFPSTPAYVSYGVG